MNFRPTQPRRSSTSPPQRSKTPTAASSISVFAAENLHAAGIPRLAEELIQKAEALGPPTGGISPPRRGRAHRAPRRPAQHQGCSNFRSKMNASATRSAGSARNWNADEPPPHNQCLEDHDRSHRIGIRPPVSSRAASSTPAPATPSPPASTSKAPPAAGTSSNPPTTPSVAAQSYQERWDPMPGSVERHSIVSPHPFRVELAPGDYRLTVEHGKEYLPLEKTIHINDQPLRVTLPLTHWIDMSARVVLGGHPRPSAARGAARRHARRGSQRRLPVTSWTIAAVRAACFRPPAGPPLPLGDGAIRVSIPSPSDSHVIVPRTPSTRSSRSAAVATLGAVFLLNHRSRFARGIPPVAPIAARARGRHARSRQAQLALVHGARPHRSGRSLRTRQQQRLAHRIRLPTHSRSAPDYMGVEQRRRPHRMRLARLRLPKLLHAAELRLPPPPHRRHRLRRPPVRSASGRSTSISTGPSTPTLDRRPPRRPQLRHHRPHAARHASTTSFPAIVSLRTIRAATTYSLIGEPARPPTRVDRGRRQRRTSPNTPRLQHPQSRRRLPFPNPHYHLY